MEEAQSHAKIVDLPRISSDDQLVNAYKDSSLLLSINPSLSSTSELTLRLCADHQVLNDRLRAIVRMILPIEHDQRLTKLVWCG